MTAWLTAPLELLHCLLTYPTYLTLPYLSPTRHFKPFFFCLWPRTLFPVKPAYSQVSFSISLRSPVLRRPGSPFSGALPRPPPVRILLHPNPHHLSLFFWPLLQNNTISPLESAATLFTFLRRPSRSARCSGRRPRPARLPPVVAAQFPCCSHRELRRGGIANLPPRSLRAAGINNRQPPVRTEHRLRTYFSAGSATFSSSCLLLHPPRRERLTATSLRSPLIHPRGPLPPPPRPGDIHQRSERAGPTRLALISLDWRCSARSHIRRLSPLRWLPSAPPRMRRQERRLPTPLPCLHNSNPPRRFEA